MIRTPDWVKHAVFYQIFPDRFARSGEVEHQRRVRIKPWGTPPEEQGYQGGDLYGIVERLGYLEDLGVTALYLNPIFASASNHRYHTYDYYTVDPLLGGNEALRTLLDAAHERGIRVVLDGVFNHASRGFWPFHHILENGGDSPYIDWFDVTDWPLNPYAPDADTPHNYEAWMGLPALPEFNTDHDEVRDFLFGVAEHWVEFGIDGWRLDVPNEIDDDAFWREFRDRVKRINPEAYIVGEIWGEAHRWLQGDQFDAVMNYPFLAPTLSFFGADTIREYDKAHLDFRALDAEGFATAIEHVFSTYDWEITQAQLNLLGSHDMSRPLWIMGEDATAMELAAVFQMTMPGAPCIYYGDEVGLSAGDDPHCREAFPWDREEARNEALREIYRRAAALRHEHEVLRTGDVDVTYAEGRVVAFRRRLNGTEAVTIFNAGTDRARVTLDTPASKTWRRVWPPPTDEATNGSASTNGFAARAVATDVVDARTLYAPARSAQVLIG